MSNLKLPSLSYKSLTDMNLSDYRVKTLAYATTVQRTGDTFVISHHGNAIAAVSMFGVHVTNAGHGSPTTRARLSHVLHSNGIKANVSQKNWEQLLVVSADPFKWDWEHATTYPFSRARFDMVAGVWTLTAVSDSQYGAMTYLTAEAVAA